MKILAYTVVHGQEHAERAELMAKAFTYYSGLNSGVNVLTMNPDADWEGVPEDRRPYVARVLEGRKFNTAGFDYVVYLDSDVLCVGSLRDCLLDRPACFQDDWISSEIGHHYFAPGEYFPNSTENRLGFCTAFITVPAAQWRNLCELWWEEIKRVTQWPGCHDQTAWNGLIAKGLSVAALPRHHACFFTSYSGNVGADTRLIHFKFEHRLRQMRAWLDFKNLTRYQIPVGELVDRYTIESLKAANGAGNGSLSNLLRAIEAFDVPAAVKNELFRANENIWFLEREIRAGQEGGMSLEEIGRRALAIRDVNKRRVALKNMINELYGGPKESKVHHASC